MSIPPLVCSTPPPPDQCEDDKDHEDFDLQYNLSQEDDDNNEYDYGGFSSFNVYESKSINDDAEKVECSFHNDPMKSDDISKPGDKHVSVNYISESSHKYEECALEDLNLKVDAIDIHSNVINIKEFETESTLNDIECTDQTKEIQDEGGTSDTGNKEMIDITINKENSCKTVNDDENIVTEVNITESVQEISDYTVLSNEIPGSVINEEQFSSALNLNDTPEIVTTNIENSVDEDFGHFEDFQFKSSEPNQVLTLNSESPWESNVNENLEFGDFKANFDEDKSELVKNNDESSQNISVQQEACDDDFGDFDDFKSSAQSTEANDMTQNLSIPNVPMLSFQSPDNDLQLVDSINNVLTSIFIQEIPESEEEFGGKLESFLSETWGHLIDIDVRQPYIVNWNNSLGQKTLLKALCIDSRNILFGPKWNYNMPKYAANLSAAPLQPQKQTIQSNTNPETSEKVPNKETGTWGDPFTPDGQESCNTEAENVNVEAVKRPTELDVLGGESSTKLNKIYSSTINVQPLRHINLPDTHIFTPTDSETPRSKTIHYDSGPNILLSQPIIEAAKNNCEMMNPSSDFSNNDNLEFQDFKGTNEQTSNPIESNSKLAEKVVSMTGTSLPTSTITFETQILQPIKLEPTIPTLNWPDPGEVKETFDDFSDFISSTTWNNDKEPITSNTKINIDDQKHQNIKEDTTSTFVIDDEFETFQSAPKLGNTNVNLSTAITSQNIEPQNMSNIHIEPSKSSPFVSEISNATQSTDIFSNSQGSYSITQAANKDDFVFPQNTIASVLQPNNTITNATDILHPTSVSNSGLNILQPTSASSSGRTQQSTGQILQPLSLESYSQINWPNPGIDLQDLSRFNPVDSLHSFKNDVGTSGNSKGTSPAHNPANVPSNEVQDDDIWGDFVSSAPKPKQPSPKKTPTFADDDEWTDFVSSPSIKPQNGLNTISFNVHTNLSMQKASNQKQFASRSNQIPFDIPTLNYITPKSNSRGIYAEKHFQNL